MNPEQITQIIETIKTLNLNVDSQSAIQIVETLKPILWLIVLKDYFALVFATIIVLIVAYTIYKIVIFQIEEEEKTEREWRN